MPANTIAFSPLIIGTMRLGAWGIRMSISELEYFIDQCLDLGLRDFDHADIYGSYTTESEFGEVLKKRKDLHSRLQLTTKCGIRMVSEQRPAHRIKSYDSTGKHIEASVDRSLKNLHTDTLDLLLLHRPDFLIDPHEVAAVFEKLRKAGKVKHFGVSNFTPSQFDLLHSFTPLATNQIEVSLLHRSAFEDGTLDQCLKHGVIPTAWSPLGGGAIFGASGDESIQRVQKAVRVLANRYEVGADQILLAWLRKHPSGILPVLGTSKVERIRSALSALEINLTHEEWYDLWQAATGEEIP